MANTITCPHCRRLLEISSEQMGREVRCPQCLANFTAGAETEITARPPLRASEPTAIQAGLPPLSIPAPVDDDDDIGERVALPSRFRPGHGLAVAVKVMLGIILVLDLAALASDSMQYGMVNRAIAGHDIPPEEIDNNDSRQMAIGIAHLIAYIATGITFLVWFSRAHSNLEALGTRDLMYTSGWAAGYWFVPILNLYRPVQVAQEIWRHSDPDEPVGANSALIGFWWMMWLVSNFSGYIAMRMALDVSSWDTLKSATAVNIFADIASIIACLLVIGVVSAIDARQTARASAVRDLLSRSQ